MHLKGNMLFLWLSYRHRLLNIQRLCRQLCNMEQLNSTVVTSNTSSSPGRPSSASGDPVPLVLMSLCFVLGVPGNIAVIILKPNRQHLSALTQSLMLNLAASDLLCLLSLPLWIYTALHTWTLGLVACKLLAYLVHCCLRVSLLTVMALGVQHYLQVVYLQVVYLQRLSHQAGRWRLLVLLWLDAMILTIPVLVVLELTTDQNRTKCQRHYSSESQQVAVMLTMSLLGFLSVSVVVFAYICLHRKVNQAAFFDNPQMTRLVTSITVSFFVLCMPNHTLNMTSVAAILLKNEGLLKVCTDGKKIAGPLVLVNNCLNPLLYAFASRNLCVACQKN